MCCLALSAADIPEEIEEDPHKEISAAGGPNRVSVCSNGFQRTQKFTLLNCVCSILMSPVHVVQGCAVNAERTPRFDIDFIQYWNKDL